MIQFTVVTICYNSEKKIVKTMESVLNQSYENIEYLLIDGASTDGTLQFIQSVKERYEKRNIRVYSEPDFGIYNAMNRAIARASGDYIIFMNVGDTFYKTDVLEKVSQIICKKKADVYYGICLNLNRKAFFQDISVHYKNVFNALINGEMPCHQTVFASSFALKNNYFKEQYKYRADFEWLVSCYKQKYKFEDLRLVVCTYEGKGITAKRSIGRKMKKETEDILKKFYYMEYYIERVKKSCLEVLDNLF